MEHECPPPTEMYFLVTFIKFGTYVRIFYSILCIGNADPFGMFHTGPFIF